MELIKQMEEIETRISEWETINLTISNSPIGWHIAHTLLAINLIIKDLQESNPDDYIWQFNLKRVIVFAINFIPRGKAKSPKVGLPKMYDIEILTQHLQKARTNIEKLDHLNSRQYFIHPYFGTLKLKHAKTFLEIHTYHHLKIIDDISTLKR